MRTLLLLTLLAGSACDKNLLAGIPDAAVDAAADAPTVDAAPQLANIRGSGHGQFVTDSGTVVLPFDLEPCAFSSDTPNGSGFDHRVGSGSSDGTFVVPVDATATSWDLGFACGGGAPSYVVGGATAPDLDIVFLGRPFTRQATLPTPVTIEATGLTAWGSDDTLEILSSNAGAFVFAPERSFATPIAPGATSIAGGTVDWLGTGTALIDASLGDHTVMYQLATQTSNGNAYVALANLGAATGLTVADGQAVTATFALAPVAQDESLAITWKRGQFDALSAQAGPNVRAAPTLIGIDALPGATAHAAFHASNGQEFFAPDLALQFPAPPGTDDLVETFTYGNPFATAAGTWDEFVTMGYQFGVGLQSGSATPCQECFGGYIANLPVSTVQANGTLVPLVSGVTAVEVAGKDVTATATTTVTTGIGTTPVVTWSAPSIGAPTRYEVDVYKVGASAGATTVDFFTTFTTTATTLQLPPGLLVTGTDYALGIDALVIANDNPTVAPFLQAMPQAQFYAFTELFTP